jgi:exo-beta-1,3-glucanase (GH17 family)
MVHRLGVVVLVAGALLGCAAKGQSAVLSGQEGSVATARQEPFVRRPLHLVRGGEWLGEGIAYGPHRDGQRPGGAAPSPGQIAEDLQILARHWRWIRVYGSADLGEIILCTIQDERLDLHVMLGAWLAPEESLPDSAGAEQRFPALRAQNRREIEAAVRLANAYPAVVSSVCVGNETQVFWSDHRCPPGVLIGYLREVRARTRVPVSTADDFNFWNKPASDPVASECDFIVLHAHPLWNGTQLENALEWTRTTLADVQARHPGEPVVLGETGWATKRSDQGDQGKLMKGRLGEPEQAAYRLAFSEWVRRERVPSFFFEAFDENWKGSENPDEVEKHWGLYRADRTPKAAMAAANSGR